MLLFQWQCLFVLIAVYPNTPAAVVLVTPPTDQFIDVNSLDNVTFLCNNSNTEDAENPVWQVQGRQIPNTEGDPDRQSFAAIGVFVDVVGNGTTQLTITSGARDSYRTTLDTTTISIQCSVFITASPPRSEVGDLLSVTTFDIPEAATMLTLTPDPDDLTLLQLSWVAPSNLLPEVPVTYVATVSGPTFNADMRTNITSVVFVDNATLDCQSHSFSVFAENVAGQGPTVSILETIPITPNITALNEGLQIVDVSLNTIISLILSFPLALSCSPSFSIQNYTLSIPSLTVELDLNVSVDPASIEVAIPQLSPNAVYSDVAVEVCISIACRRSEPLTLRTTDTQNASIVFFENNVFFTCGFASNSDARGCEFVLTLVNGTETFTLVRANSIATQCNQTMNQLDAAFVNLTVRDVEADDSPGQTALPVLPQELTELMDAVTYTSQTNCAIPESSVESVLSPGATAGIVIAALIVGVVIVLVIVLLVVYRVRTGSWFKLKSRDEKGMEFKFHKALLIDDMKSAKKKVTTTTAVADGDEKYEMSEAKRASVDTSDPTVVLKIAEDKVRLHVNRGLIKQVLQDKNIDTIQRKKSRKIGGATSVEEQQLLPVDHDFRCKVMVVDQKKKGEDKKKEEEK